MSVLLGVKILPAVHELDSSLTESTQKVRQGDNIKEQKKKLSWNTRLFWFYLSKLELSLTSSGMKF